MFWDVSSLMNNHTMSFRSYKVILSLKDFSFARDTAEFAT